jgi:HTH-type transcriptional regulator/antitoxin HigA
MTDIVPAQAFSPGEFLRDELEARDWTQSEFAQMIGRPPRLISEIIAGKRGITPETAHAFAAAFGTSAQLWMNLDAAYQLSLVAPETERITREAALRVRFPVREMQKRGWIPVVKNFEEVEQSVFGYFGIKAANDQIALPHAARRNHGDELSVIQWAWIFRVNQLATALQVAPYSEAKLRAAIPRLEMLMTEPEEIRHIPKILAECGVRLVIVEPIPGSKIDGVCFWIKDGNAPVIGLSLKGDQIDRFWFTFWHEIEHVLRGDGKGAVIVDEFDDHSCNTDEAEKAADDAAANRCVPSKAMKDFIARHAPMFSEKNMIGFSKIMKRHPGIVAGQIQKHTGRWDLFKKHQPRVRHIITETALTDGYGRTGPNL